MKPGETLWYGSGLTTGAAAALAVGRMGPSLATDLVILGIALFGLGIMVFAWGQQKAVAA